MGLFGGDFGLSELVYQKLNSLEKKLPHSTQKRMAKFIKHTVIFFSVVGPIMTLPQAYKIHFEHQAAGLSTITFASYLFLAFFWLVYGLLIKNRPIVLANILWIGIHISILTGIYLYG